MSFCDRCGIELDGVSKLSLEYTAGTRKTLNLDLCMDCVHEVRTFLDRNLDLRKQRERT